MAIKPKTLVTLRQLNDEVAEHWQSMVDTEAARADEVFLYLNAVQESIISNDVATQIDSVKELLETMEEHDGELAASINTMTGEMSANLQAMEDKTDYLEADKELYIACGHGAQYEGGHSQAGSDMLQEDTDGGDLNGFYFLDIAEIREDITFGAGDAEYAFRDDDSGKENVVEVSLNGVRLKVVPDGEVDFANGDVIIDSANSRVYIEDELEAVDGVGLQVLAKIRQNGFGDPTLGNVTAVSASALGGDEVPDGSSPPEGFDGTIIGQGNADLVTAAVQSLFGVAAPS